MYVPASKQIFFIYYSCALCAVLSACWIIAESTWGKKYSLALVKCVQLSIQLLFCFPFSTATSNSHGVLESSPSRSGRYSQTVQIFTETNKKDVREIGRRRERERELEPKRTFFCLCLRRPRYRHHFQKKKRNLFTPVSQTDQTHKYKAEPPKQTHQVWAFVSYERWK